MKEEEKFNVVRRYLRNPFFDDSDLYYNGLIDSTEYLDHKPDKLYKLSVICSILSGQKNPEKSEPKTHLTRKFLTFPNLKTKKRSNRIRAAPTLKPNALIETHKRLNYREVQKLPSSKKAEREGLRLTFKLKGNIVCSVQRSQKPLTLIETHNNLSCSHTPKPSSDERLCLTTEDKSENPMQKKRFHTHDKDDDGPVAKKCMKNQQPEEPLKEILMARLQKNNAVLVIKKQLTNSDVDPKKNRLAIPESQVINHNFLSEEEFTKVTQAEKVEAILIDPSGTECEIRLARWEMTRNWTYNLVSPWKKVVEKNNLKSGTHIELYSFRESQQLCFALITREP